MKKGSLNLSINAVVVIVLAITMLGLGLGFIRNIFGDGLSQVEDTFTEIENQRIDALEADCNDDVCLEAYTVNVKRNDVEHVFAILNNRFDCDLTGTNRLNLYVGGTTNSLLGGSTNFGSSNCQVIGPGSCSDISIETLQGKNVKSKEKEPVRIIVKASSQAAVGSVYTYDFYVQAQCGSPAQLFRAVETLEINVEG